MTLEDVISKTTFNPAKALHRESEIGTLRNGAVADVLVFEEKEGEFDFVDTHFRVLRGNKRLKALHVIREGRVFEPGSYPTRLRSLYESDYEVLRAIREGA